MGLTYLGEAFKRKKKKKASERLMLAGLDKEAKLPQCELHVKRDDL